MNAMKHHVVPTLNVKMFQELLIAPVLLDLLEMEHIALVGLK